MYPVMTVDGFRRVLATGIVLDQPDASRWSVTAEQAADGYLTDAYDAELLESWPGSVAKRMAVARPARPVEHTV